jgi:hypothetical protein
MFSLPFPHPWREVSNSELNLDQVRKAPWVQRCLWFSVSPSPLQGLGSTGTFANPTGPGSTAT